MPVFLILFLIFCGWFFYERKKNDRELDKSSQAFWERESEANMTTRKDTSDVPYLTVDFDELPFSTASDVAQIKELQDTVLSLRGKSIADLSSFTNTELKLKYGVPNFNMLSDSDENYNTLVTALQRWASLLQSLGYFDEAITVYTASMRYGLTSGSVFTGLSEIYVSRGDSASIQSLIEKASKTTSLTRDATLASLRDALARSYLVDQP